MRHILLLTAPFLEESDDWLSFATSGKHEDDVNVKHLTISQSKDEGVGGRGGMSFHLFHLNIEKSEGNGVYVTGTKRNTMSNCQV